MINKEIIPDEPKDTEVHENLADMPDWMKRRLSRGGIRPTMSELRKIVSQSDSEVAPWIGNISDESEG